MEPTNPWNTARETVNPHMIVLARESRGLSQAALAEALDATQGYVSKIETGVLAVSDEKLDILCGVVNYPPEFFFQSGPLMGVGISEIFHRKRQDVPQKLLTKIHAAVEIRIRHVAQLMRALDLSCNVPRFDIDEYGEPEEIARLTRAYWQMPRGPIPDLVQTIESAGGVVVLMDFDTAKVDAISRLIPQLPPTFCVNRDTPKDRLRFSLAHEIGHMIMHGYPSADMETEADRFASEFLMPERDIRPDLIGLTLGKAAQLKRYWKVSMTALIHRARDLGTITATKARSLWAQMSSAGYKTHEPVELAADGEQPRLLAHMIDAHMQRLGYTPVQMRRVIPLNHEELWSFYLRAHAQDELPQARLRTLHAV